MNWIVLLWSLAAGMCLMLALVHLLAWLDRRDSWANLAFVVLVAGILGLMSCELAIMFTDSPRVVEESFQFGHRVTLLVTVGLLGFVHFYFGSGSRVLLTAAILLRLLALLANEVTGSSLHLIAVQRLEKVRFLGQDVSVLAEWQPNPWMVLGKLATLAMLVYVLDATWRFWRRGSPARQRRILILGIAMAAYMLVAVVILSLLSTGIWRMPVLVSFPFMGLVIAMGWELSRNLLASLRLTSDLYKSEQRLQLAAAAGRLAFWEWDAASRRFWSSEGGELLGLPAGSVFDLEGFLQAVHPEDRDRVRQRITEAVAEPRQGLALDYRILQPGGTLRWITLVGQFENGDGQGYFRGVAMDVTEQRQSQNQFRLIVEAAPSGVLLVDAGGHIILANARAESLFACGPQELVGLRVEALLPERYRAGHAGLRAGFHAAPSVRAMGVGRELMALRRDGSEFPVEISLSPLDSPQGPCVLVVIIDISARKRAEEEVARHRLELAHLSRVSLLGELAGTIAHELNQPLAAMLSNAQVGCRMLGADAPDQAELKEIFTDIAADAKRAGGIIHGMRAMFKKEPAVEILPVDLNETVQQVLSLLHSEIVVRKTVVESRLAEGLPPVGIGRVEVQQVLINLVINSLDAIKGGSGGPGHIVLTTAREGDRVVVSVRDNGPGIAAEMLPRLFEAFATSKTSGLGLGLAICQSIVKRFGGELTGENAPGGGALFRMSLPVAAP